MSHLTSATTACTTQIWFLRLLSSLQDGPQSCHEHVAGYPTRNLPGYDSDTLTFFGDLTFHHIILEGLLKWKRCLGTSLGLGQGYFMQPPLPSSNENHPTNVGYRCYMMGVTNISHRNRSAVKTGQPGVMPGLVGQRGIHIPIHSFASNRIPAGSCIHFVQLLVCYPTREDVRNSGRAFCLSILRCCLLR